MGDICTCGFKKISNEQLAISNSGVACGDDSCFNRSLRSLALRAA